MSALALPEENIRHPAHELALKMLLAGMANAVGSTITNPADLVKVRQQLYIKAAGQTASPSFASTLVNMVRTEGIMSIYKGLSASMCREMSYSAIRMGCYDIFKQTITKAAPGIDTNSLSIKLGAGLASGCLGAAIANPADLIKVRMQAVGANKTLRAQASTIVAERGLKGLYRGIVPTTFRAGILTSSQLGSYDASKQYLKRTYPVTFPDTFKTHFVCSAIAGFVCSVTSAPVDTIKVRLMNDSKKQYSNALHALGLLLRNEGPMALYKGFFGCWIRLFPQSLISLIVFEKFRAMAGLKPI